MRVFKNLFGDGSKIHADEIALMQSGTARTLTNVLGSFAISSFSVPASSSKTLVHSGDTSFALLLLLQGRFSQGYGAYILQGYGIGGVRYRIGTIHEGTQVSVTVGAEGSRSFIISNSASDNDLSCYIVLFAGRMPSVI